MSGLLAIVIGRLVKSAASSSTPGAAFEVRRCPVGVPLEPVFRYEGDTRRGNNAAAAR